MLKSLITQKVSRQVSGESTMNEHTDTSGKMCVHSPIVQYNCHFATCGLTLLNMKLLIVFRFGAAWVWIPS